MIRKMSILPVALVAFCLFACKSVQKSADVDKFYFGNVDENSFKGKSAEDGIREYVVINARYPVKAMENGIIGHVFVEFFVESDGSVSNVKIVGGADPALEAEALRVINSSPKWAPIKIDGETVRMSYTIPINFRLHSMKGTLSSKKAELSENSLLLGEVVVVGFDAQRR